MHSSLLQVQSTEVSTTNSTTDLETLSTTNSTPIGGDSADPQSIGALAQAMRTQCAQLIGHTLVLIRNLVEACQKALRDRAALPGTCLYQSGVNFWHYKWQRFRGIRKSCDHLKL